jgi:tripartite-type tricarboxylate transporter receptor subunit TctC
MSDPEVASRLSSQTLEPSHRPPEELDKRLKTDYEMIGKLFREFGVKLDS